MNIKTIYIILVVVAIVLLAYYFINNANPSGRFNNTMLNNITNTPDNANKPTEPTFAPNEYIIGFITGTSLADILDWGNTYKVNPINQLMSGLDNNGPIWLIYSPNDKRPPEGGIVKYIERNFSTQISG